MSSLLALQFRFLWRGTPAFLRVTWGFLIFGGVALLSKGRLSPDAMGWLLVGPMALGLIGIVAAIGSGESMSWFAPLPQAARTWCRLAFLGLTGVPVAAILVSIAAAGITRLPNPWEIVVLNLWTCWVGGGLLLLFLGDIVRARHPVIQILSLLAGVAPGVAMSVYHLAEKCPWEILMAEAGAVVLLAPLTRLIHSDEEMRVHDFLPRQWRRSGSELPEAEAPKPEVRSEPSSRALDRTPALSPVLLNGLASMRPTWVMVPLWLLISLVPAMTTHAVFGFIAMTFAFHTVMAYWRPFQTVPLWRPKVFLLLTAPVLALWLLMVSVQGFSSWAFGHRALLHDGYPDVEWRLQGPKRSRDAEISPELRRGPPPKDPVRMAQLMSEAYKVRYGLDVPPSAILAVPAPSGETNHLRWLQEVERRWEGAVARRFLEWRLLLGTAVLALGLLGMLSDLPGRWPRGLRTALVGGGLLAPMMVVVVLSLETNVISNALPDPLRAPYVAVYDRPVLLAAAFAVFAAILYVRHLRVFATSELAIQRR